MQKPWIMATTGRALALMAAKASPFSALIMRGGGGIIARVGEFGNVGARREGLLARAADHDHAHVRAVH